MIRELTDETFEQDVKQSSGTELVEFFATWCPHCQHMQPLVEELAASNAHNTPVYQVDIDKCPDLAKVYAPDGFPTFVLFVNGKEAKHLVGEQTLEALREFIA